MTGTVESKGNSKVLQLDDLARVAADLQRAGKVVVQCHGVFDLMHIGHIRHFESAKKLGDVLIVTVSSQGPKSPRQRRATHHRR